MNMKKGNVLQTNQLLDLANELQAMIIDII